MLAIIVAIIGITSPAWMLWMFVKIQNKIDERNAKNGKK